MTSGSQSQVSGSQFMVTGTIIVGVKCPPVCVTSYIVCRLDIHESRHFLTGPRGRDHAGRTGEGSVPGVDLQPSEVFLRPHEEVP